MSNGNQAAIHGGSDGGVAGQHAASPSVPVFVGPAIGSETNTLRAWPTPILCWKVEDIRFAFDSSFVTCSTDPLTNPSDPTSDPDAQPYTNGDIRDELKLLASQIQQNPGCPLSVFGHADPVGPPADPDGYNKALSGRRATSIYALLISSTQPAKASSLWQAIATDPNEHWGDSQSQIMQQATGLTAGTSMSALISAYLPKLVPPEYSALNIGPANFLAQGADSQGKGDYQGCSSFNTLIIFSQQKQDSFAPGANDQDPDVYAARNLANAPNRRVMVLIFQKGSKVDPNKWPCPSASSDKSGCILRFWSDGDNRRHTRLPDQDRKFSDTHDTFACRFYQRLADNSPCEGDSYVIRIRLLDAFSKPIPSAPYQIQLPSGTRKGQADKDAWLQEVVSQVPDTAHVVWGYPNANIQPDPKDVGTAPQIPLDSLYELDVQLNVSADAQSTGSNQSLTSQLSNLGYSWAQSLKDNIVAFQLDHHRPEGTTGNPADVQDIVSQWNDTGDAQGVPIHRSITLYGKLPDDQAS
ncbi:MAG TPA: hypothetical protein VG096_12020 [Bryobacteraceae bacterium]|nr:hypothetical protein [Bryobacteraceae bacterium]